MVTDVALRTVTQRVVLKSRDTPATTVITRHGPVTVTADPEQISAAVAAWLTENPPSGVWSQTGDGAVFAGTGPVGLNDVHIRMRAVTDGNHGVGYDGADLDGAFIGGLEGVVFRANDGLTDRVGRITPAGLVVDGGSITKAGDEVATEGYVDDAVTDHVGAPDPHGDRSYTDTQLSGYQSLSEKGTADGYAELDGSGRVPSSQLPSYVDDVVEHANLAAFPVTGEAGKIYVALDTNFTYRWSGSVYVVLSPSLALGETSATAYRGDRGKVAYDHAQSTGNPHGTAVGDLSMATARFLGRTTAGTGGVEQLTAAAVLSALIAAAGTPDGTKFVRDDGTLAPAGGSVATDTLFDAKGDLPVGTGADAAAKLAVGANGTVPIADSSASTGLRYGSLPAGMDSYIRPVKSGAYYGPRRGAIGTQSYVTGFIRLIPWVPALTITIDRLVTYTTNTTSGKLRLGVYDSDGTGGDPSTLLADSGEIDTSPASADRLGTVSLTLQAGKLYWLATTVNTTTVMAHQQPAGSYDLVSNWGQTGGIASPSYELFRYTTTAYGALPSTLSGVTTLSGAHVPYVMVRAA